MTARHLSPGGHCLVVILSLRHSRPLHCKHRGPFSIAASWRYLSRVHTQHSFPGYKRPPDDELVTSFRTCPTSRHTCSQEYSLFLRLLLRPKWFLLMLRNKLLVRGTLLWGFLPIRIFVHRLIFCDVRLLEEAVYIVRSWLTLPRSVEVDQVLNA